MTTPLPPDFADLIVSLNEAKVDYMLVGGYAVMAHGYVRATQDIDIWVRPTVENAQRVLIALDAFGMPPGITLETLSKIDGDPPTGFRFGRPPFAVDLWNPSAVQKLAAGEKGTPRTNGRSVV